MDAFLIQIRQLEPKDWAAIGALIVSSVSLFLTLREKRRSKHESIIKALQGERESVAYIALRIRRRGLSRNRNDREDVITSLCLVWLQESSDRARALLLAALLEANKKYPVEVKNVLDDMNSQFDEYVKRVFSEPAEGEDKIRRGRKRIKELSDALAGTPSTKSDEINT